MAWYEVHILWFMSEIWLTFEPVKHAGGIITNVKTVNPVVGAACESGENVLGSSKIPLESTVSLPCLAQGIIIG